MWTAMLTNGWNNSECGLKNGLVMNVECSGANDQVQSISFKENLVAQKLTDIKIRYDQLDDKKRSGDTFLTTMLA